MQDMTDAGLDAKICELESRIARGRTLSHVARELERVLAWRAMSVSQRPKSEPTVRGSLGTRMM